VSLALDAGAGLRNGGTASWPIDEMGPASVLFTRLPHGAESVVVIDNTALGPAIGGVRMTPSVGPTEVARLARAMTVKNAVAGLPHGGAKAGINVPVDLDTAAREGVIRAFARAIEHLVAYIPGPDMGTDETAMAWVRDEIGRAAGLPAVLGGIPLNELGATGLGLGVCAETLQDAGLLKLDGARVVVQGFGAVGRHAARELAARGARVVAVADSGGATLAPDGLDVAALIAFKREGTRRPSVVEFPGGQPLSRDDVLWLSCDIVVPAAQANAVTADTVEWLQAGVVLQGANIPLTAAAEAELARRGVLCVPDVVANAGGVICAAVEYVGGDWAKAREAIETKIRANTLEMVDRMRVGDVSPRRAVEQMARERIDAAESYRRRF